MVVAPVCTANTGPATRISQKNSRIAAQLIAPTATSPSTIRSLGGQGAATVPVATPIGSSTPPPQSMVPAAIISVSICDGVRLAM